MNSSSLRSFLAPLSILFAGVAVFSALVFPLQNHVQAQENLQVPGTPSGVLTCEYRYENGVSLAQCENLNGFHYDNDPHFPTGTSGHCEYMVCWDSGTGGGDPGGPDDGPQPPPPPPPPPECTNMCGVPAQCGHQCNDGCPLAGTPTCGEDLNLCDDGSPMPYVDNVWRRDLCPSLTLTPPYQECQVGQVRSFNATVTPSQALTWWSNTTSVATVSNGIASCLSVGEARIIVQAGNMEKHADLKVIDDTTPCSPLSETRQISCQQGGYGENYTGEIWQRRDTGPAPECSWSGWTNITDTCVSVEPPTCQQPSRTTRTIDCQQAGYGENYVGKVEQEMVKSPAPACVWGNWTNIPGTDTCVPIHDQCQLPPYEYTNGLCPGGQTEGELILRRNLVPASCQYDDWYPHENTCSCPETHYWSGTQCLPNPEGGTTLSVLSNMSSYWNIDPGGIFNVGSSFTYQVYPPLEGMLYTIHAEDKANYTLAIDNSDGLQANTLVLYPGQQKSWSLTYSPLPDPFTYSISPLSTINLTKDSVPYTQSFPIQLNLLSGNPQAVDISFSGVSPTLVNRGGNAPCTPSVSNCFGYVQVRPDTPVGTYNITVIGTPNNVQRPLTLNISNPQNMEVTCVADPSPAHVNRNVEWRAVVVGGTAPYTYVWEGDFVPTDPAPTSSPYTLMYSTTGPKQMKVTVTDQNGAGQSASCDTATLQVRVRAEWREI